MDAPDPRDPSRRLTEARRVVVQCTGRELRHEPREAALDLMALGVPGTLPEPAA